MVRSIYAMRNALRAALRVPLRFNTTPSMMDKRESEGTVEEPLDLIKLSLDERMYLMVVMLSGGYRGVEHGRSS